VVIVAFFCDIDTVLTYNLSYTLELAIADKMSINKRMPVKSTRRDTHRTRRRHNELKRLDRRREIRRKHWHL